MVTIYSELEHLEKIVDLSNVDESLKDWKLLVRNGAKINLNVNEVELSERLNNSEDFLSLALLAYGGMDEPIPASCEFKEILNDDKNYLRDPFSIYLMNIDKIESIDLQEKFGMAIFGKSNIEVSFFRFMLSEVFMEKEMIKDDDKFESGWHNLLQLYNSNFSNANIIIDRNIFTNEERNLNLGVQNLKQFFDSILPKTLNVDYHITIITALNGKISREPYRVKLINNLVREICSLRKYKIRLETLFIHPSRSESYPYTHHRQFLMNYYQGTCQHGFDLFKSSNNKEIRVDNNFYLFQHLKSFVVDNLDTGIKIKENAKKRLIEIKADAEKKLLDLGQNDYHYRLYLNDEEVLKIQNRLI